MLDMREGFLARLPEVISGLASQPNIGAATPLDTQPSLNA